MRFIIFDTDDVNRLNQVSQTSDSGSAEIFPNFQALFEVSDGVWTDFDTFLQLL